jgi:pSer/pThr/pTyr-binding forkhead associated (FHA) protein
VGGVCYIRDEGSAKGTYVNGARLASGAEHGLRPGAKIRFGDSCHYYVYGFAHE